MATQEQIDNDIASWRQRLAAASDNLLALDDSIAAKRIEGRGGFPKQPLTGQTAGRVLPALATMRELFAQLDTITAIADRADKLRSGLNRMWRYRETLDEIDHLLNGPSIPLPEIIRPLAQRGLLTTVADPRTITPLQMLTAMTDSYATARDAVLAVDAGWSRWEPTLDALISKESTLRQQADSLQIAAPPELNAVHARIEDLRQRVATDPLGLTAASDDEIEAGLTAARTAIEGGRRERDAVVTHLQTARRLLEEMNRQESEVFHLYEACRAKIDSANVQPNQGVARLQQLETWLGSLETAAREGKISAAAVGLRRWNETAQPLHDELTNAQTANRSLIDLPAELRGRCGVVEARLRAPSAADPVASRLAMQARLLLDEPLVPVDRVEKLIAACESRLRHEAGEREVSK